MTLLQVYFTVSGLHQEPTSTFLPHDLRSTSASTIVDTPETLFKLIPLVPHLALSVQDLDQFFSRSFPTRFLLARGNVDLQFEGEFPLGNHC